MDKKQQPLYTAIALCIIAVSIYSIYQLRNSPPADFTIGTTEILLTQSSGEADRIRAVKHTALQSGNIKSLHIYIESVGYEAHQLRLAVYSASDMSLLYDSGDIDVQAGYKGWIEHSVSTGSVVEGQSYYIAQMSSSDDLRFYYSYDTGTELVLEHQSFGAFPSVLTFSGQIDADISMYITCEET